MKKKTTWRDEFDIYFDHFITTAKGNSYLVGRKGSLFDGCVSDLEDVKMFIEHELKTQEKNYIQLLDKAISMASSDVIEIVGNSALAYDQAIDSVRKHAKELIVKYKKFQNG